MTRSVTHTGQSRAEEPHTGTDAPVPRRLAGCRIGLAVSVALMLAAAGTVAQTPADDAVGIAQTPPSATGAEVSTPPRSTAPLPGSPADAPLPRDTAPRWLEAVREQRRALQERRRAQHQARRRAIDPVGTARQEAMEQDFLRRRQELRDLMAEERRLFLNFGPWRTPWPPPPGGALPAPAPPAPEPSATPGDAAGESPRSAYEPPEWDNGWYFRGW